MAEPRSPGHEAEPRYVRYETELPHARREGVRLGIFAAVNTLHNQGRLTPEQAAFRREANSWYDAAYTTPTDVDPTLYSDVHPTGVAWFKRSATELLARVPPYLAILDAHGVAWAERVSDDPGTILYEDAHQVVAVPPQP